MGSRECATFQDNGYLCSSGYELATRRGFNEVVIANCHMREHGKEQNAAERGALERQEPPAQYSDTTCRPARHAEVFAALIVAPLSSVVAVVGRPISRELSTWD